VILEVYGFMVEAIGIMDMVRIRVCRVLRLEIRINVVNWLGLGIGLRID